MREPVDSEYLVETWAYDYALHSLDAEELAAVDAALGEADATVRDRFVTEVREVREAMALVSSTTASAAPPALRAALLREIGGAETVGDEHLDSARDDRVVSLDDRMVSLDDRVVSLDERRRRRTRVLVAAAAAVAVVVGGAVAVGTVATRSTDSAPMIAAGPDSDSVLGSPDARSASAVVAGGGTATVVFSRSTDAAVVTLDGVAAPAPGRAFALWLIDGGAAPRPVGLLTPQTRTSGVVAGLGAASTFAVTVEDAAGSPAPTSAPIAAVTLA